MDSDFLRTHEINILNLRFRLFERFRFKNRKEYTRFTNKLILQQEPYVYRRFEDEYCQERLQVKVAWTVVAFLFSFVFILFWGLFIHNFIISYWLLGISVILFFTAIFLKKQYVQFANKIDFTRMVITDDIIIKVKEELKSLSDPSEI
jgi:hypothetical protein